MTVLTSIAFRVRDKGGPSGGKLISGEVPEFDFASFIKTPNAEQFVKKAYLATVKKTIREIDEGTNRSSPADLRSFEAVITRSLAFTQVEISDWVASRDWTKSLGLKNLEKVKKTCEAVLPRLASRKSPFDREIAERIATKVVAALADEIDPVADFLFSVLTLPQSNGDDFEYGFV